ncbi:MAG: hypothetical protein AAB423_00135 [Patescibacteria group bacterium]
MSEKSNKSTKKTTKKTASKSVKKVTTKSTKKAKVAKKPVVAVSNEGVKSPALFGRIKGQASAFVARFSPNKDHDNFVKLNSLISSSALIYVLLGVLSVLVLKPFYGTVSVYFQTKDFLADNANEQLLGIKDLYTIDLRWILVGLLVISAILLVITSTKKRDMYEKSLKNKDSAPRWIYLGISSVVTLTLVSLLVGLNDLAVIKMSAGLIIATVALGIISDRQNAGSKKPVWLAFVVSLFTGAIAWSAILGATLGSYIYSVENFAWYIYAVPAVVLLGFIGFAYNQYRYISGKTKDFIAYEKKFVWLDLTSKVLVFVLLVLALHK